MMLGPSGAAANADVAKNRKNNNELAMIRTIFRKAAQLYLELRICGWIIAEFGCESVASGSLWQSLGVEFPSRESFVRGRVRDERGRVPPRARRRRRPVQDSW